jgi:hypothetical protein
MTIDSIPGLRIAASVQRRMGRIIRGATRRQPAPFRPLDQNGQPPRRVPLRPVETKKRTRGAE